MSGPYARHVSGSVEVRTTDMDVQEDALKVTFLGGGEASMFIGGDHMDLREYYDGGVVRFRVRLDQPPADELLLSINGKSVRLDQALADRIGQGWQSMEIPVSCFAEGAESLAAVWDVFKLSSAARAEVSVGQIELLTAGTGSDRIQCN